MKIPYIITSTSITAVINGKTYVTDKTHKEYEAIKAMLVSDSVEVDKLVELFDITSTVNRYCEGKILVKHGLVSYNDVPVDNYVTKKILQFMDEKLPVEPIVNFLNRLMKNPSRRAVSELYTFLEHKNMPLTPDGYFLAYKGVQTDYWSKHANLSTRVIRGKVDSSGRLNNAVGEVIEVERNNVCDDASVGCGEGIHAGSLKYANDWATSDGRLMIVKIDPADVVSVPTDCSCQKLRTCKYEVVAEQVDRSALSDTMTPEDKNRVQATSNNAEFSTDDSSLKSEEYDRGYSAGEKDAQLGLDCIDELLTDSDYRDGYIDGYNDCDPM